VKRDVWVVGVKFGRVKNDVMDEEVYEEYRYYDEFTRVDCKIRGVRNAWSSVNVLDLINTGYEFEIWLLYERF